MPSLAGNVGITGTAYYGNGMFTVKTASSDDIWSNRDGLNYVYQPLYGDGQITQRVAGLQYTSSYAKAGVMIRETLDANAREVSVVTSPANGLQFIRRSGTGGGSTASGISGLAPNWLRLVRSGNTFTSYVSNDAITWTLLGTDTITMATNVYIGLAVSSANNSVLNSATFDSINLANNVPASITTLAGNNQNASINTSFATNLQVSLQDGYGNPVQNTNVTFSVNPGSGSTPPSATFPNGVTSFTVTTDGNGIATAPTFTANSVAGNYNVIATVSGLSATVSFNLSNTPVVYMAVVNTNFAKQFKVEVVDQNGHPLGGQEVVFTAPSSGASGTFQDTATNTTTTITGADGYTTAPIFKANTKTGSYTIDTFVNQTIRYGSINLVNTPDQLDHFQKSGDQQQALVTTAFPEPLQVVAEDYYNNAISNISTTFTVAPSPSGAGGYLNGYPSQQTISLTTDSTGQAQVTVVANQTPGQFAVTVSGTDTRFESTTVIQDAFNLTNTSPNYIVTAISGSGQNAVVQNSPNNTIYTTNQFTPLIAKVTNPDGTSAPAGVTVTFTAPDASSQNIPSASFKQSGSYTFVTTTQSDGTATSDTLVPNGVSGDVVVIVSAQGSSDTFRLNNGDYACLPGINSILGLDSHCYGFVSWQRGSPGYYQGIGTHISITRISSTRQTTQDVQYETEFLNNEVWLKDPTPGAASWVEGGYKAYWGNVNYFWADNINGDFRRHILDSVPDSDYGQTLEVTIQPVNTTQADGTTSTSYQIQLRSPSNEVNRVVQSRVTTLFPGTMQIGEELSGTRGASFPETSWTNNGYYTDDSFTNQSLLKYPSGDQPITVRWETEPSTTSGGDLRAKAN